MWARLSRGGLDALTPDANHRVVSYMDLSSPRSGAAPVGTITAAPERALGAFLRKHPSRNTRMNPVCRCGGPPSTSASSYWQCLASIKMGSAE